MKKWKPGDIAYFKQHCAFGPAWKGRVVRAYTEQCGAGVVNSEQQWEYRRSADFLREGDEHPIKVGQGQLHESPEAAEEYYRPQKEALFGPVLEDIDTLGIQL